MSDEYLLMQGEILLAERDTDGDPIEPWYSIGDAPACEIKLALEKVTVKEAISGFRRVALSVIVGQEATVTTTFRSYKPENVALMMLGVVVDVAGSTVSAETFPDSIVAGESFFLDKRAKITSLVITDSAGSPATVPTSKYSHDGYGFVTFLDVTGYTQPFKAAYTYGAIQRIPLLTTAPPIRMFRQRGINTGAQNASQQFARRQVDLWKVQFDPADTLALIQEKDVNTTSVVGTILSDDTKPEDATHSRYGEFLFLETRV